MPCAITINGLANWLASAVKDASRVRVEVPLSVGARAAARNIWVVLFRDCPSPGIEDDLGSDALADGQRGS